MSKKNVGTELVEDIIKRVLANRGYDDMDELFIRQVASNTIRATPVIDILTHMKELCPRNTQGRNDDRLARCIEVLALVNSMIDYQLSEKATG